MNSQIRTILIHVLACAAFLALPVLFSLGDADLAEYFRRSSNLRDLSSYLLTILFFYINYLLLVPRLYFNRKYFFFSLCVLAGFALIAWIPNLIFPLQAPPVPNARPSMPPPNRGIAPHISHNLLRFSLAFFIALLLRINTRWQQTEQEKLNAELSFLRAQINPHFLFNTLNSIYSLAIEKSDDTPEAVAKLSGMMRYVTSEAGRDLVPLDRELGYIRDYIELQKFRFGDTVRTDFSVTGSAAGKMITPLVLIPFVENAFKYGVNPEQDSDIRIAIALNGNALHLEVANNKVPVVPSAEEATGLGVANTRERLQLLYPGKHTLGISEDERQFRVSLTLELT
ncbi:MAG: histidine kinase [Saprospiraceae bacterium]|nr:histidine kinase [Saprospiraceae bacterium]